MKSPDLNFETPPLSNTSTLFFTNCFYTREKITLRITNVKKNFQFYYLLIIKHPSQFDSVKQSVRFKKKQVNNYWNIVSMTDWIPYSMMAHFLSFQKMEKVTVIRILTQFKLSWFDLNNNSSSSQPICILFPDVRVDNLFTFSYT